MRLWTSVRSWAVWLLFVGAGDTVPWVSTGADLRESGHGDPDCRGAWLRIHVLLAERADLVLQNRAGQRGLWCVW